MKLQRYITYFLVAALAGAGIWLFYSQTQTPPPPQAVATSKPILRVWSGKCVGVHDGDSIRVLNANNESIPIRLEGIDAPELKQPFGKAAKSALSSIVFGRTVEVHVIGKDFFDRTLAFVVVEGENANTTMVQTGHAWHFTKYNSDKDLAFAEADAKKYNRGLWALDPTSPWEWRKQEKEKRKKKGGG